MKLGARGISAQVRQRTYPNVEPVEIMIPILGEWLSEDDTLTISLSGLRRSGIKRVRVIGLVVDAMEGGE